MDVLLNSTGNVIDRVDYGVGGQWVTPFVARRMEDGYLLTSEGATGSRLAHIVVAIGGCERKDSAICLVRGTGSRSGSI